MVLPLSNPTKSFWIEGAKSDLRDHRSTPDLPNEVDVVIIGSGYTGATSAYWLHRFTENGQTPSMLMLEARDVCGGATGRNGGQLRPHLYSRYPNWSVRFGKEGALAVIQHEAAHLTAFNDLFEHEGIAEEVCFKLGETFDAAMTEEAWTRLKGAYETMKADHGDDGDVIRDCRLIEDPKEAEDFTQMKGCIGAIVHPSGQVWPYKFVHALLRIVLKTGRLNLQANTPVSKVGQREADGRISVETPRGTVRAKAVLHATNRWASHLLPDFEPLVYPGRATVGAIKAPEGFIKHTGAQHWDSVINNYHLQLPPPYNSIVIGGAKSIIVKAPELFINNDEEDKQMPGVPEYYSAWPKKDIAGWVGAKDAELEIPVEEGGVWTGIYGCSADSFPFVGRLPDRDSQYIAAGFSGHGMPRILLSTCHIAPVILQDLGTVVVPPRCTLDYPPLPQPFHATRTRLERLRKLDLHAKLQAEIDAGLLSSKKVFDTPQNVPNGNMKINGSVKETSGLKEFPVPDAISEGAARLSLYVKFQCQ